MRHLPAELQAVVHIFSYDEELRTKALPHVNIEKQSVNWLLILRKTYGSGHYAAIAWAWCLWMDKTPERLNLFSMAFAMNEDLRKRVAEAIALRWSVPMGNESVLKLCA